MSDQNDGKPTLQTVPGLTTASGLIIAGNGQYAISLFPYFMQLRRDFFVSALTGSLGPRPTLGAVLPADRFNVNVIPEVALGSLTWAEGRALGLTSWDIFKENGNSAEAQSRNITEENGGTVIPSQEYRRPNGQILREIDSGGMYRLGWFGINGTAIEQVESKAGEPKNAVLDRALAQVEFDSASRQLPTSMANRLEANQFPVDGIVSQQGLGTLIPAARAEDSSAQWQPVSRPVRLAVCCFVSAPAWMRSLLVRPCRRTEANLKSIRPIGASRLCPATGAPHSERPRAWRVGRMWQNSLVPLV